MTHYNKRYFDRYQSLAPKTLPCFTLIMAFLNLNSNDTVLDLGCGVGDWTQEFNRLAKWTVGVDAHREPLIRAKGKHRDVDFVIADAGAIPFRDASFSKVSCLSVIEHLDRPILLLREMARVMKDGSTTVLVTPDAKSAIHRYSVVYDPTHKRLYNQKELVSLVLPYFDVEATEKSGLTNKLGPLSRFIKSELVVKATHR